MNNKSWNWSDVRVFLAVAREGSTLAASRALDIAQPTVARRIDVLEHETGLTLFERHTRGFTLTKDGQKMLARAEALETAAQAFSDTAQDLTQPKPIRITAFSGNFSRRVIDIIDTFSNDNPGVTFEFIPSVKVVDLMKGEADIALRLSRNAPDPDLICRKVSLARWTLFGSPAYAEKFGLPASPDDFAGHRFVTYQRSDISNAMHEWLSARVERAQIVASYSELELMHAAIRSGKGLGLINVKLVEQDEAFLPCFDEIKELAAEHYILVSPEAYRRAEVKKFMKFFAPRYAEIFS